MPLKAAVGAVGGMFTTWIVEADESLCCTGALAQTEARTKSVSIVSMYWCVYIVTRTSVVLSLTVSNVRAKDPDPA